MFMIWKTPAMDVRVYFLTIKYHQAVALTWSYYLIYRAEREPNLIGAWQCDNQVTNQQVSRPHTRVNVRLFQVTVTLDLPVTHRIIPIHIACFSISPENNQQLAVEAQSISTRVPTKAKGKASYQGLEKNTSPRANSA